MEQYLWQKEANELADELVKYTKVTNKLSISRGLSERWRKTYNYYYNNIFKSGGYGIGTAGENEEYATISVNHLKNLANHIISIVSSDRLAFDCLASSADFSAQKSARIGTDILDHIIATRNVEAELKKMLELGLIFGTSFCYVHWDTTQNLVGTDGEGKPIYAGDISISALSPYDITIEPFLDKFEEQQWVIVRKLENKHILANSYPALFDEIISIENDADASLMEPYFRENKDFIRVYYGFHKECPALPNGRFIKYLETGLVLENVDINPYGQYLPVVCFRPAMQHGSAYGYTPLFDMLPVQEGMTMLDTTIMSNQRAFGSQNIAIPRSSNINKKQLSEGLSCIEYDSNPELQNSGLPTPLQLLATPAELFNYRNQLKAEQEQMASISPINRGQVASGLSSGTALAILSSQSVAANSSLEAFYNVAIEHVATRILYTMGRYAKQEELVAISGKNSASAVSTFQGEDLKNIQFVKIIRSNPLSKNYAGRSDIADKLLNAGLITHPSEYFNILTTGNVQQVYEQNGSEEQAYLRWENEQLLNGQPVEVAYTDNPTLHILVHRTLMFQPTVRQDQNMMSIVMEHIIAHQTQLEEMSVQNPMLLQLIDSGKAIAPQPLASTRSSAPASIGGGGGGMPSSPEPSEMEAISQGDLSKTLDKANNIAKNATTPT